MDINGVYMLLYSSGHCSGIHLSVATLRALKQSLLVTDIIFVVVEHGAYVRGFSESKTCFSFSESQIICPSYFKLQMKQMVNDNERDYYDAFLSPCQKVSFVTLHFLALLLRSVSHSASFHPCCLNS